MKRLPFVRIRNPLFLIMHGGCSLTTGACLPPGPENAWRGLLCGRGRRTCFLRFSIPVRMERDTSRMGCRSGQDDSFHGGTEGLITELLQGMLQEALRYHSARRLFRNAA